MSWKKVVAFSVLPLALLFGAAFQSSNSVPGQLQAIQTQLTGLQSHITGLESHNTALGSQITALQAQVASLANKGPRKFYLSIGTVPDATQAPSACAMGYHMASLWEIHDTSNLRYNTVLGLPQADSGSGPPSAGGLGWIRTGSLSSASGNDGQANCNAFTSGAVADTGTIFGLNIAWSLAGTTTSPWAGQTISCSSDEHVWCVEN